MVSDRQSGYVELDLVRRQIQFARDYTNRLLEDIEDVLWFRQPGPARTHVAWQVGHLAVSQYGLCLFRQRGRLPIDRELMPSRFRKRFGRGSAPGGAEDCPSPAEILATLERVHQQSMEETSTLTAQQLSEPVDEPYAVFANRSGALLFCAHHEMLHAGQIGLLRRLLGKEPVR